MFAACIRICADGGANRLYDSAPGWAFAKESTSARRNFLPTVIKGDLDSLRPEVADFYSSHGTGYANPSATCRRDATQNPEFARQLGDRRYKWNVHCVCLKEGGRDAKFYNQNIIQSFKFSTCG
jgi:thiamine pyrophosphokinase